MTDDNSDDLPLPWEPSLEEIRAKFIDDVKTLGGQSAVAREMYNLGDRRGSVLRSIQRMAAGDTKVSGEMQVIIALLMKARRRAEYEANRLEWHEIQKGRVTAKTKDFTLSLAPESGGRWHVSVVHKDGYSHPFPKWQPSLQEAKIKALVCLEDAEDELRVA